MKTFLITFPLVVVFLPRLTKCEVFTFSENFKFGSASAAYQIEGAWNEDGKSPSIWDTFTHEHPEMILDRSNGDESADSYHFFEEDIKVLKLVDQKFHHYRFSISWSRIIINGTVINQKGVDYYSKLIDALIENKIEPIVTLYHFDLPQYLQVLGGLVNPLVVEYFTNFADVAFKFYGSRVKRWITFNEPFYFCNLGYSTGTMAPGVKAPGVGEYLCAHNTLKAHASAYHLYKEKYFNEQQGQVGISLNSRFFYRRDENVDEGIPEKTLEFCLGWFAHPIFSLEGGYPEAMVIEINRKSLEQGFPWSRLPTFSDEEKLSIVGSSDFLALNYYTSRLVAPLGNISSKASFDNDVGVEYLVNANWKRGKSQWLYSVPEGLTDLLVWIKEKYNNPIVLISENGFSDDGELNDVQRIEYLREHLASVAKALTKGCNVIGYTVWSIIDNFEWINGYSEKFGIFAINFTSELKERTTKASASFMKEVILNNSVECY